MLIMKESVGL